MSRIPDAAMYPLRQLAGAWSNFREAIDEFTLRDLLPAWLPAALAYIRDSLPRSLGFADNPADQLTAVVTLTITMIVASATTLTFVAVGYAAIFGPIAVLRLLPAIQSRWPVGERDWPLWAVGR